MSDPNIVYSGLSRRVTVEGHDLKIDIYRSETDTHWVLEVIDEGGTSTVWDDLFPTDQAAIDEALKAIEEEGLSGFIDIGNVVPFPGNP
jgi:hypothetical protein